MSVFPVCPGAARERFSVSRLARVQVHDFLHEPSIFLKYQLQLLPIYRSLTKAGVNYSKLSIQVLLAAGGSVGIAVDAVCVPARAPAVARMTTTVVAAPAQITSGTHAADLPPFPAARSAQAELAHKSTSIYYSDLPIPSFRLSRDCRKP
jgi:hypothetical protein